MCVCACPRTLEAVAAGRERASLRRRFPLKAMPPISVCGEGGLRA